MKIFIIGKVRPEPKSSAAGTRMMQLIHMLKSGGHNIHFGSAASETEHSENLSGTIDHVHALQMNDDSFNQLMREIQPDVVIYDRFMTEEQFGWRVHEVVPTAISILNTEDLHFLRSARERNPDEPDLSHEDSWRELAAILRCDLNLIISEVEMDLLKSEFSLRVEQLHYLPLLFDSIEIELPGFEERSGFCTIGNFLHKPNLDAVIRLKAEIWPDIRKRLQNANMHIYGAYTPEHIQQMHKPEEGFLVHGRADDVAEVLKKHRVMLAPLRFGAGLKGKLLESMKYGITSVTTSIGAEGINGHHNWPGFVQDDMASFAEEAVRLHEDERVWNKAQNQGYKILSNRFNPNDFEKPFLNRLDEFANHLESHRQKNWMGEMLRHQSLNATKFMGKWIEDKNRFQN